jgi:hypothetical protein
MYRILQVYTPSYSFSKYNKLKQLYQENIKEAHKRFLKLKVKLVSNNNPKHFKVDLIGFDGTVKYSFTSVNKSTFKTVFNKIDAMPLGNLRPGLNRNIISNKTNRGTNKKTSNKTKKRAGLSLYADYNPKTTLKGTGYKDEATAKRTLKLIANRDLTYQKQVVNTMYNRAKYHPHQTNDMLKAMYVYSKWLSENKKLN